jgi:murein DD-endopeptidase MepM/ murein hydrolase activator NlpD
VKLRYLALALVLLFSGIAAGQKPSKKSLLGKAASTNKKASTIRKQLRATKRQAGYVMSDIRKADGQLEGARDRLSATQRSLSAARKQQATTADDLKMAIQSLANKKTAAAKRLRALYMQGSRTPIDAYLTNDSFSDAVDREYAVKRIAEQDGRVLVELREARDEVARQKLAKDRLVAQVSALKGRQTAEKAALDRHVAVKRGLLAELRSTQADLQDELDALAKESAAIEAELRKYYSQPSKTPIYRGAYALPVAGRISSTFGFRRHPILKRRKLHTGVDISAPAGTPIRAAGSGKVIYSSYRGGYGNCIIIDHGGGVATLYGHCSRLYAGVGRNVDRGDVIAAVGSTGFSTGPHCHWELRINGTPVNPLGR